MSTIFPTQYSTLSARALGEELVKRYQLPRGGCRLLMRNVSDTYLLETAGKKFVFKLYRNRHRNREAIQGEAALLTHLHEKGARVSYPLADAEGNCLQAFQAAEGLRWGLLFTFAEGQPENCPARTHLKTIGDEMARIHEITEGLSLPFQRTSYTGETTITFPLRILPPALRNLPQEHAYLRRRGNDLLQRMKDSAVAGFSHGYCHFDFMPKNFHFAGGKITFFDFDFAGPGPLIYDIVSFYAHYFLEVYYHRMSPSEARRNLEIFLSAYSKRRSISDAELSAIRDFGFAWWLFYLGFQQENYEDWSSIFFNERFVKARVDLMKRWMEEPLYFKTA